MMKQPLELNDILYCEDCCEDCELAITQKDREYIQRMENAGLCEVRACDICEKCFKKYATECIVNGTPTGDDTAEWSAAFE